MRMINRKRETYINRQTRRERERDRERERERERDKVSKN